MRRLNRVQTVADIEAVEATRGEAVGVRLLGTVRRQPVDEVVGTVGHGAHSPGAHVQAVGIVQRGIGDAEADDVAALDQHGGLSAFGQAGGQHGAGKAAADDDHGQGGSVVHRLTSPMPAAFVKGIQIS
ncbi:hypothetical protein D3C80_1237530 [compost metagenome]